MISEELQKEIDTIGKRLSEIADQIKDSNEAGVRKDTVTFAFLISYSVPTGEGKQKLKNNVAVGGRVDVINEAFHEALDKINA